MAMDRPGILPEVCLSKSCLPSKGYLFPRTCLCVAHGIAQYRRVMKKVGERLNVMKASLAKLELFSALAVAGSRQEQAASY